MQRHEGFSLFTRHFTTSPHDNKHEEVMCICLFVLFVTFAHWPLLKTVFLSVACTILKPDFTPMNVFQR